MRQLNTDKKTITLPLELELTSEQLRELRKIIPKSACTKQIETIKDGLKVAYYAHKVGKQCLDHKGKKEYIKPYKDLEKSLSRSLDALEEIEPGSLRVIDHEYFLLHQEYVGNGLKGVLYDDLDDSIETVFLEGDSGVYESIIKLRAAVQSRVLEIERNWTKKNFEFTNAGVIFTKFFKEAFPGEELKYNYKKGEKSLYSDLMSYLINRVLGYGFSPQGHIKKILEAVD